MTASDGDDLSRLRSGDILCFRSRPFALPALAGRDGADGGDAMSGLSGVRLSGVVLPAIGGGGAAEGMPGGALLGGSSLLAPFVFLNLIFNPLFLSLLDLCSLGGTR